MARKTPKTPGERLHAELESVYDLAEHEAALLAQTCQLLDLCVALQQVVDDEGPMTPDGSRAHPAVVELRQQRITLARLLAALRVPTEDDVEGRPRLQRRGPRGVYQIGGGGVRRKPPPPAAEMPARLRLPPPDDDYAGWLAARRAWAIEHGVSPLDVLVEAYRMRRGEVASGGSAPGHARADES